MPNVVSRVFIKHEEQREGESTHYCDRNFVEIGCDYKTVARATKRALKHVEVLLKNGYKIEDMYLDTKIIEGKE